MDSSSNVPPGGNRPPKTTPKPIAPKDVRPKRVKAKGAPAGGKTGAKGQPGGEQSLDLYLHQFQQGLTKGPPRSSSGLTLAPVTLSSGEVVSVPRFGEVGPIIAPVLAEIKGTWRPSGLSTYADANKALERVAAAMTAHQKQPVAVSTSTELVVSNANQTYQTLALALTQGTHQARLAARLRERILKLATPQRGVEKFNLLLRTKGKKATKREGITQITNLDELNQLFPDATMLDLCLTGLLRMAPPIWIEHPADEVVMLVRLEAAAVRFNTDEGLARASRDANFDDTMMVLESDVIKSLKALVAIEVTDAVVVDRLLNKHITAIIPRAEAHLKKCEGLFNLGSRVEYLPKKKQLDNRDLLGMLGLLERMPNVLIQKEPFIGSVAPLGAALCFIPADGSAEEVVAMHPFAQREGHSEGQALAEETQTHEHEVVSKVWAEIVTELQQKLASVDAQHSLLEDLAAHASRELGVELPSVRARILLGDYATAHGNVEASRDSLKMGALEMREIIGTLSRIPKPLRDRVIPAVLTAVTKPDGFALQDGERLKSGCTFMSYDPTDKKIWVSSKGEEYVPFARLSEDEQALYSDELLHEFGLALWGRLSAGERAMWPSSADGLLNDRARLGTEHDFAECFAAYLNHGPDFSLVMAADRSKTLSAKHAQLARIVGGPSQHRLGPSLGKIVEARRRILDTRMKALLELPDDAADVLDQPEMRDSLESEALAELDPKADAREAREAKRASRTQANHEDYTRARITFDSALAGLFLGGKAQFTFDGRTVKDVIGKVLGSAPQMHDAILTPSGALQPGIRIRMGQHDITAQWAKTPLKKGESILIEVVEPS